MNADTLRHWADYIDNPKLPRPEGVDPRLAPKLLAAMTRIYKFACQAVEDRDDPKKVSAAIFEIMCISNGG